MDNQPSQFEGRRQFIKRSLMFAVSLPPLVVLNSSCQAQRSQSASKGVVGGGCDGCEGIYEGMPERLNWQTMIAPDSEPGERMDVSGVIYQADGKTPAPNVILYAYHTDAKGYYSPAPGASALARRHGHLRGWVRTSEQGEYRFTSIKPAPYPNANIPAHIHPIIKEPDRNEYYIDEYVFDDDPLLTKEKRSRLENRGGSGIIQLTKSNGVWAGRRNITLGLNIPNYS
jgi:protocatechuate 3,4-dioxygenase beta subunit